MYKFAYAEILDEAGTSGRERERQAFDMAMDLLVQAQAAGPGTPEMRTALLTVQKMWRFFIADIADAQNELPETLRVNLASLGLWIIQEADRILSDPTRDVALLIDVNRTIRDGLK
ncbi:flagellar biosynthesis regulator FlaF [Xanthobacter variabilis]|uniref:flagellar biosynthesis regulator FlaF n=1 Tax=Xanthobacter variabilis TaxID=3119932 RepID=UPI00372B55BB